MHASFRPNGRPWWAWVAWGFGLAISAQSVVQESADGRRGWALQFAALCVALLCVGWRGLAETLWWRISLDDDAVTVRRVGRARFSAWASVRGLRLGIRGGDGSRALALRDRSRYIPLGVYDRGTAARLAEAIAARAGLTETQTKRWGATYLTRPA